VRRNFGGNRAMIQHAQNSVFCDFADFHRVESPLVEHVEDFPLAAAFRHQQHALLRFAQHDFVRRHPGFALRHPRQIDFNSQSAARGHLGTGTGQPRGAHILNRDDGARAHGFEAGFEQKFFEERIADLHVRAFLLRLLAEFCGGQQRCAVDSVASGFRADVNDRIARTLCFGEK